MINIPGIIHGRAGDLVAVLKNDELVLFVDIV